MRARRTHGFTLLEMMVVVTISLIIVTIIVSVFQVSTRTVKTVERKLAVYEAARNVLDIIHGQIVMAVTNERGDQFSIKSLKYANVAGFPVKAANPDVTARYGTTLRREADAVQYGVINAGCAIWRDWSPVIPGSYVHAVGYVGMYHTHPGAYKASLRSTLAYPKRDDYDASGYIMTNVKGVARPVGELRQEMLNDSGRIELMNYLISTNHETIEIFDNALPNWNPHLTPKDQIHQFFAPGNEPKYTTPITGDVGRKNQARMSGIRIMDLDVAYWDEEAKVFKDPPDNSVIYFAPAPKAVRVTITVCDTERRSTVTLCRVIQLAIGSNPAAGVATSKWIKPDDGDYAVPIPCNQVKNVLTIEPTLTQVN
jgi:prepilin-type N-terminal cleavage/methylation domain-containing protein